MATLTADDDDTNTIRRNHIADAPKGLLCPYCGIRECCRTTVINKHLKWLCDICFKEILEYEQEQRQYKI